MHDELDTNGKAVIVIAGTLIGIIVLSLLGIPVLKLIMFGASVLAFLTFVWVMKVTMLG